MFEELKKDLLIELKNKIIELTNDKEKLKEELNSTRKESLSYSQRTYVVHNEPEIIDYANKKSKLYKVFNKKKYNNELNFLKNKVKKDLLDKHNLEENKIKEIEDKLNKIDNEINEVVKNIEVIEKVKSLEELPINFDSAKELLAKNNVNIASFGVSDMLKLGNSDKTTNNVDFMRVAVNDNQFNIIYDNTNNYDLYYELISNLDYKVKNNDSIEMQNKEIFDNSKKSVLKLLEQSKNGKIIIKPVYILEVIRFYFKDVIMYENGALREGNNDDIIDAITRVDKVIKKALELSPSDYEKLESMYNPKDNDYYCHRTGTPGVEEAIFQNGLSISSQGTGNRYIVRNARKVDCFLAMVGYENFYAGNGAGDARIILEIPKNEIRPIGSNTMDGKDTHVLPQYVMASLYDGVNSNNKTELHINNHQNDIIYKYLYKDGYDMQNIYAITNPDYDFENDKGMGR